MSAMQRTKGQTGEREAAELVREHTGWDVRRRVRQHDARAQRHRLGGLAPQRQRKQSIAFRLGEYQFRLGSSSHRRLVVWTRYTTE